MNPTPESTSLPIKVRLMVMMFLQYFVQGSYLPIITLYLQNSLHFKPEEMGIFTAAIGIGPLLAPFILGQVVDRYVSAEHVLATCHLAAAGLMALIYFQSEFALVLVIGTVYSILYIPTLMLTNAVAFHHLKNRDREFPLVRLWGTIGFIVPAWFIEMVLLRGLTGEALNQARGMALLCSAVAGIVMAAYCLSLPHTPPAKMKKADFAPAAVLRLLRRRDFFILVAACFFIAMVHSFYFTWNSPFLNWFLHSGGIEGALEQRISSIGQISEVAVMVGLGLMITRMGFKDVLALGVVAYLLRCLIFAGIPAFYGPYWLAMGLVCFGQALHGFCFGCFLAASFMYVDRISAHDVRGSMQTFYGTFVFGLGAVAGGLFAANVGHAYTVGTEHDWTAIWLAPAILATLTLAAFVAFFPKETKEEVPPEPVPTPEPTVVSATIDPAPMTPVETPTPPEQPAAPPSEVAP